MTRVLSEMRGATEPTFHHVLSRLEAVSGHGNTDIRLSTEIERATRHKLKELGLDPKDTTGAELYAALQQRVKADDERLVAVLAKRFGQEAELNTSIAKVLLSLPIS